MHRAEARQYLVVLSATDGLVTALVADLLNSDIAAARLTAIELLPQLQGLLSEDVAQKLAIVMWDDWDAEVGLFEICAGTEPLNSAAAPERLTPDPALALCLLLGPNKSVCNAIEIAPRQPCSRRHYYAA